MGCATLKNKIALLLSLILISGICNDYLTSTVENYGDGNMTVREVWTNIATSDYSSFIREATITVNRAAAQSYIDYPIQIISNFPDANSAPWWTGFTSSGSIAFDNQQGIKVLKQDGEGIWNELPMQISYLTKCKDALNNLVDCSNTYNRVNQLVVYFLDNLTSDSQSYKVMYKTFGPPYDRRFIYNETSGNYYYTEDPFPTRVKYQYNSGSPIVNITENNEEINLGTDGSISSWKIGCPTSGSVTFPNAIAINCTGNGLPKTFGLNAPSYNFDAPIMVEFSKPACDLMSAGSATGYINYMAFFPEMKEIQINSYSSITSESELFGLEATGPYCGCGVGLVSVFSPGWGDYTNHSLLTWGLTGNNVFASNATSTDYGMKGGGVNYGCASQYAIVPYYISVKSTLSNIEKITAFKTLHGNVNSYYPAEKNRIYVTNVTIANKWTILIAPNTNTGTCQASYGYASYDTFSSIIRAEPSGGKIQKFVTSYSAPCVSTDTYDKCRYLSGDSIIGQGIVCNSDDSAIGYYDSCDTFHSCYPCDGNSCVDGINSKTCGSQCWGSWLNKNCTEGKVYGTHSCTMLNTLVADCYGAGCNNGVCGDTSQLSTTNFAVTDYPANNPLGNVYVNIRGSDSNNDDYYTNCTTSSIGTNLGCVVTLAPGHYQINGTLSGYKPGAGSCVGPAGIQQLTYAEGCIIDIPPNALAGYRFNLLSISQNENSTQLTVKVMFHNNPVHGATVRVNGTGEDENKTVDVNGEAKFTFDAALTAYTLSADAPNYIAASKEITLQVGKTNKETIMLDMESDIIISNGASVEASRVFASGYFMDKVSIPLTFDKPGKLTISRDSVLVHPCADGLCNEYQKMGLNVLYIIGTDDNSRLVYNLDDGVIEFKTKIDFIAILQTCSGTMEEKFVFPYNTTTGGLGETVASFKAATGCYYNGINYKVIFNAGTPESERAAAETIQTVIDFQCSNVVSTVGGIAFGPVTGTVLSGVCTQLFSSGGTMLSHMIRETATLAMVNSKQDVLTDYVIFNLNTENLMNCLTDPWVYDWIRVQGATLTGTCPQILVNPVYSPLVGTGQDPLVNDQGILSYNVRATNTVYDTDSRGLPSGGLEAEDRRTSYISIPVDTNYTFTYKLSDMNQDIEYDLKNENYASASIQYFNQKDDVVDAKIDATKFKVETYLDIKLQPNDGSPEQHEFVKVISFIDTGEQNFGIYLVGGMLFILIFGALFVAITRR